MSHLPLSLMNRLNQTESTVLKLWMLYLQRISFSDYLEILIYSLYLKIMFISCPNLRPVHGDLLYLSMTVYKKKVIVHNLSTLY